VQKEIEEFLWGVVAPHAFASLKMPDVLPPTRTFRDKSTASECDDTREISCRNQYFAAAKKDPCELPVVWANDIVWQELGCAVSRETLIDTGISKPFG
jgi:hypothetical protein